MTHDDWNDWDEQWNDSDFELKIGEWFTLAAVACIWVAFIVWIGSLASV